MSQILYARGLWGMPPSPLKDQCQRIADAGFDAVEAFIPINDFAWQDELAEALRATGLSLIAQVHGRRRSSAGPDGSDDSLQRLTTMWEQALALKPLVLNWHLGSDSESLSWNHQQLDALLALARSGNHIALVETHRGRMTWNAAACQQLLQQFDELRLCADLSHWCCVHESLLQDFTEAVQDAVQRSWLIHARVGHPQGSQVGHWRDPVWDSALQAHLGWWDAIVAARQAAGELLVICPEFGPAPYQQRLPFTGQAVSDNWELNESMMILLRERYGKGS